MENFKQIIPILGVSLYFGVENTVHIDFNFVPMIHRPILPLMGLSFFPNVSYSFAPKDSTMLFYDSSEDTLVVFNIRIPHLSSIAQLCLLSLCHLCNACALWGTICQCASVLGWPMAKQFPRGFPVVIPALAQWPIPLHSTQSNLALCRQNTGRVHFSCKNNAF